MYKSQLFMNNSEIITIHSQHDELVVVQIWHLYVNWRICGEFLKLALPSFSNENLS